jgi:hypothetical protein
MTRTLDGTYWRVYSSDGTTRVNEGEYSTIDEAYPMASQLSIESKDRDFSVVRIRPRTSIARAVRLLTEARKQGVELWMRRSDHPQWLCMDLDGEPLEAYGMDPPLWRGTEFNSVDVLARWIVATPSDARKIDAKRAHSLGSST